MQMSGMTYFYPGLRASWVSDFIMEHQRGLNDLWTGVNHIAIVVSDVGKSLAFYSDVIGMKQVMRPNFDRHGAWLTFGNVDLHLIKGRPAVHDDDDLIVSHIAITVSDMSALKKRLEDMKVPSRKNVSVPNPSDSDTGVVEQQFVRDPDGYYIECCNCERLEKYLHEKMAEDAGKWNFSVAKSVMNLKGKMLQRSSKSKLELKKQPSLDEVLENMDLSDKVSQPDEVKMSNLIKRRKIYGDITQNASEVDLAKLLRFYNNDVPSVILYLENKVRLRGKRTYIPPAFFERDGTFVQPPAFEMPIEQAFNDFALETSEAIEKRLA